MGNAPSSAKEENTASPQTPSACPVNHSTREAYLSTASNSPSSEDKSAPIPPHPLPPLPQRHSQPSPLDESRVTSSIPRAATSPPTTTPSPASLPASPSSESHPSHPTPSSSAHWIYPSERMFFEAMRRKSYSPNATDMSTIVPIHNAVNERAWHEILGWERGSLRLQKLNEGCGGPKLRSFEGDSGKLSPRARWRSWIGYEKPFDRHDWVVERCGGGGDGDGDGDGRREAKGVEYVIDFYKGRGGEGKLNFHLDVRPKLNSWEGWRMRLGRWIGMG